MITELLKPTPVIDTAPPAFTDVGLMFEITGESASTANERLMLPPTVVTTIGAEPFGALIGTVNVIVVAVFNEGVTGTPPTVTVAFERKLPDKVTVAPRLAPGGFTLLMIGASITVNAVDAVPPGVVKVNVPAPDAAIAGTITVNDVGVTAIGITVTPPMLTAPVMKFLPVTVMLAPRIAAAGDTAVITGVSPTTNGAVTVTPCATMLTTFLPADAASGTLNVIAVSVAETGTTGMLPNETVAPPMFLPLTVTNVPRGPLCGLSVIELGGNSTTVNIALTEF